MTLRYFLNRREFSIRARMIGSGKDTSSPYRLRIYVFLLVVPKYGDEKNLWK